MEDNKILIFPNYLLCSCLCLSINPIILANWYQSQKKEKMVSEMCMFQVLQLNTNNCDNWSIKTNDLVGSQDVWEVVEKGYKKPQDETTLSPNQRDILKDMRKRDRIALTVIHQAMNGGTFEKISNATTSKEV